MSVSIKEALEGAGFNFTLKEDCQWLLSQESDFEDLLDECNDTIDMMEEAEDMEEEEW